MSPAELQRVGAGRSRLVRPQPAARRRPGSTSTTPTTTRVSPEYNEVRHAGVTMGLYQAAAAGLPGALRVGRPRAPSGRSRGSIERRRLGARSVTTAETTTGATALLVAGLADPARGHRRRALRRRAAPARALPGGPDRAVGRRARVLRPRRRRAGARPVLEVLHGRGLLGARAPAPRLPRRGLGRGRRPHRRVPGDRRATRSRTTGRRSPTTGRPTACPRPWRSPIAADPPLTADELDYAREQAGLFGFAGALGRPALRPLGRSRARRPTSPRGGWFGVVGEAITGWWLTAQADATARRPARAARRARHLRRGARRRRAVRRRRRRGRPRRRSGWRAPGSSTATTRMDDQQHALAGLLRTIPIAQAAGSAPSGRRLALRLAVGGRAAAGAEPGAGRLRRAARRALAARGGRAGGSRRHRSGRSRYAWPPCSGTRCSTRST